jgi:DNA-binding SARP family transcriptional activator
VLRLCLLRSFRLLQDGLPVGLARGSRRLLAMLAVHDLPLPRAYVSGRLWPDVPQERAAANLRSTIWRIRRQGLDLIRVGDDQLALHSDIEVDFREAAKVARGLLRQEIANPAELEWSDIAADLLPDSDDEWIMSERERFRQLRLHALESLAKQLSGLGRHALAIDAGLIAVEAEPLRESAHRVLMEAFLAEGNAGEALTEFLSYQQLTRRDLKVEPSAELRELVRNLL